MVGSYRKQLKMLPVLYQPGVRLIFRPYRHCFINHTIRSVHQYNTYIPVITSLSGILINFTHVKSALFCTYILSSLLFDPELDHLSISLIADCQQPTAKS